MARRGVRLFMAVCVAVLAGCAAPAPTQPPPTALRTAPTALPAVAPTAVREPTAAATAQPSVVTAGDLDRQFIDMMVPHHEGALDMARIAQQRAERPEIKAVAADILRTQAAEIAQMKALRKAWFGSDTTPPMTEMPMLPGMPTRGDAHAGHAGALPTMNMAAEVDKLRAAPEPFDLAFIAFMVPHHQDAIDAGRATFQGTVRPEIRTLATSIINTQQNEIVTMQQWQRAWSGSSAASETNTSQAPAMEAPMKDEHAEAH
jgi:uncharacterized protein (DUF305 family)